MAWSVSAIFQQALVNPLALGGNATSGFPTSYAGLVADTVNVALFGTLTPDKTAAVGSTGYGTGVWAAGEVTDTSGGSHWNAGGVAATTKTYGLDSGSSSVIFKAANTAGSGTVTLTAFFGCLVYDNTISGVTVAKQGMCFNYFGGTNTITAGTFTILWPTPAGAGSTAVFNISV
jgi:hypothetical protein